MFQLRFLKYLLGSPTINYGIFMVILLYNIISCGKSFNFKMISKSHSVFEYIVKIIAFSIKLCLVIYETSEFWNNLRAKVSTWISRKICFHQCENLGMFVGMCLKFVYANLLTLNFDWGSWQRHYNESNNRTNVREAHTYYIHITYFVVCR